MKAIQRSAAPILALSLGLGLLAAGCGSDSNSDNLTQSELTSKATAICTPVAQTVNAAVNKMFSSKPSPQAFAEVGTSTVLPQFTKQTDALAELKPPSDLEDAYASYIDSAHQVEAKLKADPAAPFTGDPVKFYADSNAKATAAGLPKICLAGPSAG
jgi:hypothetical protein